MTKNNLPFITMIVLIIVLNVFQTTLLAGDWTLSCDSPASRWRESLPLGNGHLGVTVFGGVCHERLQLSENSIYSGGWGTLTIDPLEAEYIKRQREIAVGGDVEAATALTFEAFKKHGRATFRNRLTLKDSNACQSRQEDRSNKRSGTWICFLTHIVLY